MNKLMTIRSYLSVLLLVGGVSLGAPTLLAQQGARAKQRATNKNAPDDDEVDYVNLAAMLVSDGYYDRAAAVLSKLSAEDVPPERLGRYHLLMGLIQLDSRAYEAAIDSLSAAIEHGQHQDAIFVYLAQCYDGLGDHKMTVHSIDAAGDAGKASPGLLLIKANALLKLGEKSSKLTLIRPRLPKNEGLQGRSEGTSRMKRQVNPSRECVCMFVACLSRGRPMTPVTLSSSCHQGHSTCP